MAQLTKNPGTFIKPAGPESSLKWLTKLPMENKIQILHESSITLEEPKFTKFYLNNWGFNLVS